jgi:hypothetical protein
MAFRLANGPGFSLQVFAFPARNPYTRCGLYTAIPNAPPTQSPNAISIPIKINYIYIKV